ncbi:type III-I CRISPR-associated protein Cas10i [Desulfonatronum thioautotrophicum]|uniref:type III-I CRISPR-associated protein Cas10i n=1 Tax=Desulfonatronum thioautotrophicum TaxID=617001 RepID=UPI0005EB53A3|nr:hypothetical protein [Desulfonatronum thioautotrophicum]
MLTPFDWIRLAFTGAELLATLDRLAEAPSDLQGDTLGPPLETLDGPCERCMLYPRVDNHRNCRGCASIMGQRYRFRPASREVLLVWGCLNRLPYSIASRTGPARARLSPDGLNGFFILDDRRFLKVIPRWTLKNWLQDILLYDDELHGLLQIFPTYSARQGLCMSDLLCHVVFREANIGTNNLWVRFYAEAYHVRRPQVLDKENLLNFPASEFLGMMNMGEMFQTLLSFHDQEILRKLLLSDNLNESQFNWGRFQGLLEQDARDMLDVWQIRQWPKARVQLFYDLLKFVPVDSGARP